MAGGRGDGLGRDYVAATEFNVQPLLIYLRQSANSEELRARLKQEGFTHLMFNMAEILARGDLWFQLDGRETLVWNEFRNKYLRLIFEQGDKVTVYRTNVWCAVFTILSEIRGQRQNL